MNYSDVQNLLAQGFTAEFIMGLNSPVTAQKPAEETKPETNPKPAAPAQDAQKPAAPAQESTKPRPEPAAPAGTEFDRLMARLDALTAQMQEQNRAAAEMGANIIDPRKAGISGIAALSGYELKKEE